MKRAFNLTFDLSLFYVLFEATLKTIVSVYFFLLLLFLVLTGKNYMILFLKLLFFMTNEPLNKISSSCPAILYYFFVCCRQTCISDLCFNTQLTFDSDV